MAAAKARSATWRHSIDEHVIHAARVGRPRRNAADAKLIDRAIFASDASSTVRCLQHSRRIFPRPHSRRTKIQIENAVCFRSTQIRGETECDKNEPRLRAMGRRLATLSSFNPGMPTHSKISAGFSAGSNACNGGPVALRSTLRTSRRRRLDFGRTGPSSSRWRAMASGPGTSKTAAS